MQRTSKYHWLRRKAGLCYNCGKKSKDKPRCDMCAYQIKKRIRERHEERLNRGACVKCGFNRVSKYKTCNECRVRTSERLRNTRARNKAKNETN